jgi:3-hydroxyisobutyrate dehydrogenase
MRIGFIGLGIMGRGMVKNLVLHGHEVCVWNRTRETAKKLFPQLRSLTSPAELAANSDMVISCVSVPEAVEQVLLGPDGVCRATPAPALHVECSTIGPAQGARLERELAGFGIEMLAAPVTGSRLGADAGTLIFIAGGAAASCSRIEPVLSSMGRRVIHCGTVAQAFAVKLANNGLVSFMLQGLCEGSVVLSRNAVPMQTWLEVVQASVLGSEFYAQKGKALATRDFSTHFSLDLLLKDQTLLLEQAHRDRVPMPGLAAIREIFRAGQARGLGAEDMAGVVRVLEALAGDAGHPA